MSLFGLAKAFVIFLFIFFIFALLVAVSPMLGLLVLWDTLVGPPRDREISEKVIS